MLDQDEKVRGEIKALVDEAAEASGFKVVAWRPVPVDLSILGEASAETVPHIEQLIVAPLKEYEAEYEEDAPEASDPENPHKFWADKIQAEKDLDDLDGSAGDYAPVGSGALERGLYLLRRRLRGMADEKGFGADSVYVASFSSRTITYKGMVNSNSLGLFYKDLADERYRAQFCIYHRR